VHNLDLKLLEAFLAVFDTRSVGQAALRLRMSQPGLSTALGRLRRILQDPLFVKTPRGMEPTTRARALYDPVRGILEAVESGLFVKPGFDPATSTREFRLALSDIGEGIYLPLALQGIAAAAPGVTLRSVSLPPRQLEEAMDSGKVDLAAGYFPDIRTGEYLHRRVGLHSFACIMRSGHPLAGARLTMKQFTALRHVVIEAGGRSQEVLEKFFRSRRIRRTVVLHTPHFMSVPVIVASTDVVAIVPQALADFITTQRGLTQVPLPFVPPTFQVNLHWHRSVNNDPGNKWLRDMLFAAIPVLQARGYDRNGRPARARGRRDWRSQLSE
jgi:DNA-binding transcriptional LysR family regulator